MIYIKAEESVSQDLSALQILTLGKYANLWRTAKECAEHVLEACVRNGNQGFEKRLVHVQALGQPVALTVQIIGTFNRKS